MNILVNFYKSYVVYIGFTEVARTVGPPFSNFIFKNLYTLRIFDVVSDVFVNILNGIVLNVVALLGFSLFISFSTSSTLTETKSKESATLLVFSLMSKILG